MNGAKQSKDINKFKIDDKPVIITNQKTTMQRVTCLTCPDNVALKVTNYNEDTKSDLVLTCPCCKRNYFPNSEIMHYEDILIGPHDDTFSELEGTAAITTRGVLLVANDDYDDITKEDDDANNKKGGFYSMDYVKGPGKTIEHLEERLD